MSLKIYDDFNNLSFISGTQATLPQVITSLTAPQKNGSVVYDPITQTLFYSTNNTWLPIATVFSLQNIGTGNVLIAVPPNSIKSLQAGANINIADNGTTITISATGTFVNSVTTISNTTVTILTIPLANNSSNLISAKIAGINTTTNAFTTFSVEVGAKNNGGILTISAPFLNFYGDQLGTNVTVTSSGTNLLINVVGALGQTINWNGSGGIVQSINI